MAPSKLNTIDFTAFSNIINCVPRSFKTKYHDIDPATKQPNWDGSVATPQDVDDVVAAASKAQAEWKKNTWEYHTERLARFRDAIEAYRTELIELLTKETSKPRIFATVEFESAFPFIDWYLKLKQPAGKTYEDDEKTVVNKYTPLGVAVGIWPWNFPFTLSFFKVLPAVQMGNAIIIKPSPSTPT